MDLKSILLLTGLKRKLGNLLQVAGSLGVFFPDLLSQLPAELSLNSLKVFLLGVVLKRLGELHAKMEGRR